MQVKDVAVRSIKPYKQNPRVITDESIKQVAASIEKFGWQQPIVVDSDHTVIAGHTRLRAAKHLGLKKVPVLVAADLTTEQIQAYRIADNRSGEMSVWDGPLLNTEINDLLKADFSLEDLGFTEIQIDELTVDVGTGFEPTTDPTTGTGEVTDEDIEKTQARLGEQQAKGSVQVLIDVTCPHCMEDFQLDPKIFTGKE